VGTGGEGVYGLNPKPHKQEAKLTLSHTLLHTHMSLPSHDRVQNVQGSRQGVAAHHECRRLRHILVRKVREAAGRMHGDLQGTKRRTGTRIRKQMSGDRVGIRVVGWGLRVATANPRALDPLLQLLRRSPACGLTAPLASAAAALPATAPRRSELSAAEGVGFMERGREGVRRGVRWEENREYKLHAAAPTGSALPPHAPQR
jgi:hypothetical protein